MYTCPKTSDGQFILSPREFEIISMLCCGLKPKEICARLGLAENSLRTYVMRVKQKLRCRTLVQAGIRFKTFYEPRYASTYSHAHIKARVRQDGVVRASTM